MVSKGVFSLLLISTIFAQSVSTVFFEDMLPTILILFVVAAAFIALFYIAGKLLNNASYLVLAKTEIWQLILTVVIFFTYASMLFGFQQILAAYAGVENLNEYVLSKLTFFETELKDAIAATSTLQYRYIVDGSVRVPFLAAGKHQSLAPQRFALATGVEALVCLPFIIPLPQCLPSAILNYLTGSLFQLSNLVMAPKYHFITYSNILETIVSSYASFAEMLVIPLRIGFSFLFSDLIAALPLMAVILRLLPFTRQAGNMIFTLSFAFGAVFPFLLAFFYATYENFDPVPSFCQEPIAAGGKVSDYFTFGPFPSCEANHGFPKMISFYPIFTVVPYLSLAIALTFATNFNKLFDYFKR